MLNLVICPGYHGVALTESLISALNQALRAQVRNSLSDWLIHLLPDDLDALGLARADHSSAQVHPLMSLPTVLTDRRVATTPTLFIGFSAGVLTAWGAAHLCALSGQSVLGLIALDGWGVPLAGPFPIRRISHDAFTHYTTAGWGGTRRFYADPPIDHLTLWGSPGLVQGWKVKGEQRQSGTALDCLVELIEELALGQITI